MPDGHDRELVSEMMGHTHVVDLHPQAKMLKEAANMAAPLYLLPVHEARARMRAAFVGSQAPPIARTGEVTIDAGDHTVPARFYHPRPGTVRPVLVFVHGGGWILNDLDVFDRLCAEIANEADCLVLSVDYRRSPEHRYPAALDDVRAALEWASSNAAAIGGDPGRIALGGDSAGGAIAAGLAKWTRDHGGPVLHALLLLYPVADYLEPRRASYDERGPGFAVNQDFMSWIWSSYLPEEWQRDDPYLFPLQGALEGLPHTIVCVAEYDVLRDEGVALAERLAQAGVSVDLTLADDQMHGFAMYIDSIDRAAELVRNVSHQLKRALTT